MPVLIRHQQELIFAYPDVKFIKINLKRQENRQKFRIVSQEKPTLEAVAYKCLKQITRHHSGIITEATNVISEIHREWKFHLNFIRQKIV